MKRVMFLFLVALLSLPAASFAAMSTGTHPTTEPQYEMGVDVEMPYNISADGTSINERGDTLIGVHGNYFVNPNWYIGTQFDYAVETQAAAADNAFLITPGTGWSFMPSNTIDPYVRFDVPLAITGGGSTGDGFDAGISGGVGLKLNLGDMTGMNGLALKYDTALNYMFDAKLFSVNIFRFAVAYCW